MDGNNGDEMPKTKKIVNGVPHTRTPKRRGAWAFLKDEYTFGKTVDFIRSNIKNDSPWILRRFLELVDEGIRTESNWREWNEDRNVLNNMWLLTPEYQQLNAKFMEEYNSREDMQEMYREHSVGRYYFYDADGTSKNGNDAKDAGWTMNPTWYGMYENVMGSWDARASIAKSVECEFQEGDIVKLRASSVGRRYADPLYMRWQPFPGKEVDRIGTVLNVTEELSYSRGGPCVKGRMVEVLWIGKEETTKVQEKHLRFLERPTYKNGLKVREGKE